MGTITKQRRITMKKVLYLSVIAVLATMLALDVSGLLHGYWMVAGHGLLHSLALVACGAMIALLWIVQPPRPMSMRVVLAVVSVVIGGSVIALAARYQLGALDAVIGIMMALLLMTEAFEYTPSKITSLGTAQA